MLFESRRGAGGDALDIGLIGADANARSGMFWKNLNELRLNFPSLVNRERTTRVEAATARRVDRRRHVTLKDDAPARRLDLWVGNGYRRNERFCVRH